MKNREVQSTPHSNRLRLLLLALFPILSVFLFGAISFVSFFEIKNRRPPVKPPSRPVSAEILAKYQAQSKELKTIREQSRESLTIDGIFDTLQLKPEEIPVAEKLIAAVRAIEGRSVDSTRKLFSRLLLFLEKILKEDRNEARIERTEALLSHLIFSNEGIVFGIDERATLFQVLEGGMQRESKACGAYLHLFSRSGGHSAIDGLKALKTKARNPQLAQEFSKAISAIEKKVLAKE